MLYATLGQSRRSARDGARGDRAEALLPTPPASIEVDLHVWRREFDLATVLRAKAVELHPYLQVARAACAGAAVLRPAGRSAGPVPADIGDVPRSAVAACAPKAPAWQRWGLERRALPILEGLEQLRKTEYVDAITMAVFRSALGQRDTAFAELERACAENAAPLFAMKVDPKLDTLRADRRTAALFA